MKSGGKTVVTHAFLNEYVKSRKMLCRESKATIITPRKGQCSKELYKVMLATWKKVVKKGEQKRFMMAMPAVSKKVAVTCALYATRKGVRSNRAARKQFLACSTAFIRGRTSWLKQLFTKARIIDLYPLVVLSDATKPTFVGALKYLSLPSCAKNYGSNWKSLYPTCEFKGRVIGSRPRCR